MDPAALLDIQEHFARLDVDDKREEEASVELGDQPSPAATAEITKPKRKRQRKKKSSVGETAIQIADSSAQPSNRDLKGQTTEESSSVPQPAHIPTEVTKPTAERKSDKKSAARAPVARPTAKAVQLSPQQNELKQLQIRYKDSFKMLDESPEGGARVRLLAPITDPDFPFDLPAVDIEVVIPSTYLKAERGACTFTIHTADIPPHMRR